jgi:hypothetical protein
MEKRLAIVMIVCGAAICTLCAVAIAQTTRPQIFRISPTSGPEGSRVVITGENLQEISAVFFGGSNVTFSVVSSEEIVALVPHKTLTSAFSVVTPRGSASSPFAFVVASDPRVPDEVSYKAGFVNPIPAPREFKSALLWGIAIADIRVPGHESATVEIASTQLSCRVNGEDVVLNQDNGEVRGGLYRRNPWFGTDQHEPMPAVPKAVWDRVSDPVLPRSGSRQDRAVVLAVGQRSDRVWHFWSASPRATMPSGNLDGCIVKARVRISPGALLQMGMDYWRNSTTAYGAGGNNHEAGASNWYFPSDQWQEAVFTDIGGPQF